MNDDTTHDSDAETPTPVWGETEHSRYGCPHCEVRMEIVSGLSEVRRVCPECDYYVPGFGEGNPPDEPPIDMGSPPEVAE